MSYFHTDEHNTVVDILNSVCKWNFEMHAHFVKFDNSVLHLPKCEYSQLSITQSQRSSQTTDI